MKSPETIVSHYCSSRNQDYENALAQKRAHIEGNGCGERERFVPPSQMIDMCYRVHQLSNLIYTDPYKSNKVKLIIYMVTPYMDHDLSGLLENPNVKFTEPQIKCYMLQLLEGTKYLHEVCADVEGVQGKYG